MLPLNQSPRNQNHNLYRHSSFFKPRNKYLPSNLHIHTLSEATGTAVVTQRGHKSLSNDRHIAVPTILSSTRMHVPIAHDITSGSQQKQRTTYVCICMRVILPLLQSIESGAQSGSSSNASAINCIPVLTLPPA